jgi:hypothetical protein
MNGGASPPPHLRGVIGTCSASFVLTMTMPLEVVRRRLQVQVRGQPAPRHCTALCIAACLLAHAALLACLASAAAVAILSRHTACLPSCRAGS